MKITGVAAAVIERPDGAFLLGQRAEGSAYAGYWEFPGGKVEDGETPHQAVVRELQEELGIRVTVATPWLMREHRYEHAHVRIHFFRVTDWRGEPCGHVHAALAWQRPEAPEVTPMLPANAPILRALALPDFYGITHAATLGVEVQLRRLERALEQGLRMFQVREPALSPAAREEFARRSVALARRYGARVLLNMDIDLARRLGADGVHLPARELARLKVRPELPLVAVSCHRRDELEQAADLGCDFAVLGPVAATPTHPEASPLGWEAFAHCLSDLRLPVYALGGMVRGDIASARRCGAQGVAALRGAWPEGD
ncbi:MAG: Nudix family hydrolase [Proteobacteria bacterium]|nr:Nudix family hydrolase [Pseudomonadota bacterium]HQR03927.1 Nudix family hydrolase [Rhodocyclaceae bacterium]